MTPQEELQALRRLAELEARSMSGGGPLPPQGKSVLGLSREAQSYRPSWVNKDERPGMVEELAGGAKHRFDTMAQGLAGLFNAEAVSPEQQAAGKAFVEETGPASSAGEFGTDFAVGAGVGGGILKGANVLKKAMAARGIAGAGTAAVGLDAAGNAAYNAAITPEDRGTAALWGAGGTLGGRALARTLGGPAKPFMTPEAKQLSDAGVQLTPGQMVGGSKAGIIGNFLRKAEDALQSVPIVGDVIKHGRERSIKSWNTVEINEALKPLGKMIKKSGREGIEQADEIISQAFESAKANITVPRQNGLNLLTGAPTRAKAVNVLFDPGHEQKLEMFIERRLKTALASGDVPGEVAKRIDAELGSLARKYRNGGVGNEPLGDAFDMLRSEWRGAMVGKTPADTKLLEDANKAFAKFLPMSTASEASNLGLVSPAKLRTVTNQLRHAPTPNSLAARDILPDTVPDSGTPARLILHSLITPESATGAGAAAVGAGLGPLAGLGTAMAGMYTRPGAAYMARGGEDVLQAVARLLRQGPITPDKLMQLEDITRVLSGQAARSAGNTQVVGE